MHKKGDIGWETIAVSVKLPLEIGRHKVLRTLALFPSVFPPFGGSRKREAFESPHRSILKNFKNREILIFLHVSGDLWYRKQE